MATTKDSFEYTATGVLGEQRGTMLNNELHLRNELGRSSRRGYVDFPGDKWRYGMPNPPSTGGVSQALGNWNTGLPPIEAQAEQDRDFISLNREAVKSGIVTAGDQYQFRAVNDIRRKPQTARDRSPCGNIRRLPPSMVFGISTRPSTPIHDLLENKFQDKWIKETRAANLAQKQQIAQATTIKMNKPQMTRASQLRTYHVPVASAPLWQMSKFTRRAAPSLSTFRTETERSAAYRHNVHDRIARHGIDKAGVYMSAAY